MPSSNEPSRRKNSRGRGGIERHSASHQRVCLVVFRGASMCACRPQGTCIQGPPWLAWWLTSLSSARPGWLAAVSSPALQLHCFPPSPRMLCSLRQWCVWFCFLSFLDPSRTGPPILLQDGDDTGRHARRFASFAPSVFQRTPFRGAVNS